MCLRIQGESGLQELNTKAGPWYYHGSYQGMDEKPCPLCTRGGCK